MKQELLNKFKKYCFYDNIIKQYIDDYLLYALLNSKYGELFIRASNKVEKNDNYFIYISMIGANYYGIEPHRIVFKVNGECVTTISYNYHIKTYKITDMCYNWCDKEYKLKY